MIGLRAAWSAVAALFILNGALFGMWVSRIPVFRDRLGLSHSELGLVLLFLAAGAVLSFPVAGRLVDRYGAAPVSRWIGIGYGAALLLLALAPNVAALALALFLFGAAHGAMDVAMNAFGAEVEREYDRQVMSSFHAMWSFGAGLGALSGAVAAWVGASVPAHFLVAGPLVTGAALWIAHVPWPSRRSTLSRGQVFAFPSGMLLLVGFMALAAALGEGAVADWGAVHLRDSAGASEGVAALGYGVFSVSMVAMRLLGDAVIRRVGAVAAARASGVLAVTGASAAVLFSQPVPVIAGFALMGIGYAVIMPLAFSRAANDPEIPPGQAIASVATLGYGGMLIGPPLIGFVAELTSLRAGLGLLVLLAAGIVALAGALRRP